MQKIKNTFLIILVYFLFIPGAKALVLENVNDYSSDIYLIGSTRFDSNVVVTSTKAALAKANESKLYLALGLDVASLDVKTYYYNDLFEEWYLITSDNELVLLSAEEQQKLENNLNIFYIDNIEKILEYEYTGVVDENSLTNGVTYQNGKFYIPATTFSFKFTANGANVNVQTEKIDNSYQYGNFYISYEVNYFDERGNYLGTLYTDSNGLIDTEVLYQYTKDGMNLTYLTREEREIALDAPITENLDIIQKWIPVGTLQAENGEFNHLQFVYYGDLSILDETSSNGFYIRVYAPKGYDTINTTIEYQERQINFNDYRLFDDLSESYYVELWVEFASQDDVEELHVVWEDNVTTDFEVLLGNDVKFERMVQFYVDEGIFASQKVLEGDSPLEINAPIKENYTFAYWAYEGESFDFTTPIYEDITLEAVYVESPQLMPLGYLAFLDKIESFKKG